MKNQHALLCLLNGHAFGSAIKFIILIVAYLMAALVLQSCQTDAPDNAHAAQQASESIAPEPKLKGATIADVEAGIRAHIANKTEEGEGFFDFTTDSAEYRFKLVRVHTQYLSVLGPNRFFACVDLADESGDVYDVDFFLEGEPGNMRVTETTVHKLNGKPRYTWKQAEDKTWFTVPIEDATNQLIGVIEGNDAFEFFYAATVPELTEPARLWLPLAQSDDYQTVQLKSVSAPVDNQELIEARFGNGALLFELKPEHSGATIEIAYEVQRMEKAPYPAVESDFAQYLAATELQPVGGRFQEMVDEVIRERQPDTELMKARALYDYVIDNVRYAKQGTYGTGDANFACDSKSGNCTEFHSLFISLARTAGIPARFAIGAAIPSERSDGGVNGYHCWAEIFADGKWWPVDISEGNKYTALATYYFGHHPANRLEFSRGRDLKFEPGPATGPINFFAYPVLESAAGTSFLKTSFSFLRHD